MFTSSATLATGRLLHDLDLPRSAFCILNQDTFCGFSVVQYIYRFIWRDSPAQAPLKVRVLLLLL